MRDRFMPFAWQVAGVVLALAPIALAQSPTRIVPRAAAPAGNQSSNVPLSGPGRVQLLFAGSEIGPIGAIVQALSFRAGAGLQGTVPGKTLTMDLWIGYSANAPDQMSTAFASNPAGAMSPVFRGQYDLPAQPLNGAAGPWNISFKLAAPFVYIRTRGHLLIDIDVISASTANLYFVDAVAFGSPAQVKTIGQGGIFASQERGILSGSPDQLWPGGQMRIHANGLRSAYPALMLLGLSGSKLGGAVLPLDLGAIGAPGNVLFTSAEFAGVPSASVHDRGAAAA